MDIKQLAKEAEPLDLQMRERVPLTVAGMAPLKLSVTGQCVVATPEVSPLVLSARVRDGDEEEGHGRGWGATTATAF